MKITEGTPVGIFWEGDTPLVELRDLGNVTFTDPFFDQSVARAAHGSTKTFSISEICHAVRQREDLLSPSGFIFHMSRCGSTTVSQTLSTHPGFLVVSEPEFTLDLLDPPIDVDQHLLDNWLVSLVLLLGSRRRPTEKQFVIKWHSLHTAHLERLRRIFPDTPWIFVHREPTEVMVSALANPSRFVRLKNSPEKAAKLLGCNDSDIRAMGLEEYAARVLALYCTNADAAFDEKALQVDYRTLPNAIWTHILSHFSLDDSLASRRILQEGSKYYSKDTGERNLYKDDSATKFAQATPAMREACERWVTGPLSHVRSRRGCYAL